MEFYKQIQHHSNYKIAFPAEIPWGLGFLEPDVITVVWVENIHIL